MEAAQLALLLVVCVLWVSMKHAVGVNAASDPLYTILMAGVNGGLVSCRAADDPGLYSSQNEQDTQMCSARAAMVPVLEPSDSQGSEGFCKICLRNQ